MGTNQLRFSKGAVSMRVRGWEEGRMQRAAAKAVGNSPDLHSSFEEQFLPERSQEVEENWPNLSQHK